MVASNTLWGLVLSFFLSSIVEARIADKDAKSDVGECATPYVAIGPDNYCLFIDNRIEGTWDQMRSFCKEFNGDLAFFKDANLLYEVVHYINENRLNDSSFWIGGEDLLSEGDWVWAWDNQDVRMNTPLWGSTRRIQEPLGGTFENCGILNKDKYYFMDDLNCDGLAGVICDPLTNQKDKSVNAAEKSGTKTKASAGECPVPFERIRDSCLLINSIKSNTWEDGKLLCQGLGGHMARVEDANILGDLYDIFLNKSITSDLWLGGTDNHEEGQWVWEDNTPVRMETPFWGMNYFGHQEPTGGQSQNCLGLTQNDFFYFNDLACTEEAGVICQYDMVE